MAPWHQLLLCAGIGFVAGGILLYLLCQKLIGRLAFELYFTSKLYVGFALAVYKGRNLKECLGESGVQLLADIDFTADKAKHLIPSRFDKAVDKIDNEMSIAVVERNK